jgi:hypothetical protein
MERITSENVISTFLSTYTLGDTVDLPLFERITPLLGSRVWEHKPVVYGKSLKKTHIDGIQNAT